MKTHIDKDKIKRIDQLADRFQNLESKLNNLKLN